MKKLLFLTVFCMLFGSSNSTPNWRCPALSKNGWYKWESFSVSNRVLCQYYKPDAVIMVCSYNNCKDSYCHLESTRISDNAVGGMTCPERVEYSGSTLKYPKEWRTLMYLGIMPTIQFDSISCMLVKTEDQEYCPYDATDGKLLYGLASARANFICPEL